MGEVQKLQQHLALLKQEYSKLNVKYQDLQSKYNVISAANDQDTFAARLLHTVSTLYHSSTYSDISIKLADETIPSHRFVLTSRSPLWNDISNPLDWSEIDPEISPLIIKWLYRDTIELPSEEITLKLIRKAFEFQLQGLINVCEKFLIEKAGVRSCVKFYSVAEEVGAETLREYCWSLISSYWDELNGGDFDHMSGSLLYQMLKNKAKLPLHAAVRLQREDVVFLCLVENASRLNDIVNVWSSSGELPLDLALRNRNVSIATTLVQHNADLNIRDDSGDTLLHRSIKQEDAFTTLFLLENNCNVSLSTGKENDTGLHLVAGDCQLAEDGVKIAQKLLNKNININAQNRAGFTALHIAIQADNRPIFDLLLNQVGLDFNLKTNDEHTVLYYALLKYQADDEASNNYCENLLEKKLETDVTYSNSSSLLQKLILDGVDQAAIFLIPHLSNINYVNLEGESALHTACSKNSHEVIEQLLESNCNANLLTNDLRQSALHYCVTSKSLEALRKFQNKAVNWNIKDINGETPVSLALHLDSDLVPVLIEGGADVNVRNSNDLTLLHQAIMKGDTKTALFLLENGADINAQTSESVTPLQLAIQHRLVQIVDALCIRGVDMSRVDDSGDSPLWTALANEQDEIASVLVRHGADPDCWGPGPDSCRQTLLHRAIDENKESVAIFLIQAGCDLNSPRIPGLNGEGGDEAHDGASPLHLCCQWGLKTVVRTLIEHRANINSRDSENKTPIHIAIENQHPEIISLLLSVPEIDLSLRDKTGLSPFAAALTFRNDKAAQAILDKLPSAAEQFNAKGQNFLHVAIKKGDIESTLFLLSVNVDVNSRVQDPMLTPPLLLAAQYGNETLVRSLILAGARVDDRDSQKRTALHVAAEFGNAAVVPALLQNTDALDIDSNNALHVAVREGHLNVVRALLTESTIDAEAVNLKGRNPLHELCKYGKDNAATICELFLECMPEYPINKTDILGNSPLLLAYMNGNGSLCRALVKAKACLGTENSDRVTIFNYQVASKQLLNRLLDQLSQPAMWTSTDCCQECGKGFALTVRPHHCRHCGRALCDKCSDFKVPIIKFSENKPVRVCKVCFDVLRAGSC